MSDFQSSSSGLYAYKLIDLIAKSDEENKSFFVTSIFDSFVVKELNSIGELLSSKIKEGEICFILKPSILDFNDLNFKFSVANLKQIKILVDSGNFRLADDFKTSMLNLSNLLVEITK